MSDVVGVVVHGVVSAIAGAVQGGDVVAPVVLGDAIGCVIDDAVCDDATFVSAVEVGGVAGWSDPVGVRVVVVVSDDVGDGGRLVDGAGWSCPQ